MEMEYIGKISKLLIESHRKNKTLDKVEIRNELAVSLPELNSLLYKTQEYLSFLGLEMVGISPTQTVPIDEGKKFFVRKQYMDENKRIKMSINIEDKKLFIIISAIQLENNRMHEDKKIEIQKCKYFKDIDINVYMNGLRTSGYIQAFKENDFSYWSLGWRYYVEYSDCFDIFEYFSENNKTQTNENSELPKQINYSQK